MGLKRQVRAEICGGLKNTGRWVAFSLLALGSGSLSYADLNQAKQLFERAAQLSPPASGRYSAHLSFRLFGVKGGTAAGSVYVAHDTANRVREEIVGAGVTYKRLEIRDGEKLYLLRPSRFDPLRVQELTDLIGVVWSPPQWQSDWRFKKLSRENSSGESAQCVRVELPDKNRRTYCFSEQSGALLAVESRDATGMASSWMRFAGHKKYRDILVPDTMTYEVDQEKALEVSVDSFDASPDLSVKEFIPPAGVEVWDSCDADKRTEPKPLSTPEPDPPSGHSGRGVNVRVGIVITVSATGSVADALVSDSGGSDFDEAALKTVKRWRFEPARCGSRPIASQASVDVHFFAPLR